MNFLNASREIIRWIHIENGYTYINSTSCFYTHLYMQQTAYKFSFFLQSESPDNLKKKYTE